MADASISFFIFDCLFVRHLEVAELLGLGVERERGANERHEVAAVVEYRATAGSDAIVGGDFKDIFVASVALVSVAGAVRDHAVGEVEIGPRRMREAVDGRALRCVAAD